MTDTATKGSAPQKYVPRFKRDANAVPSFRLYTQRDIAEAIPGEASHTFNRAFAPVDDTPADEETCTAVSVDTAAASHDAPARPLADEFCRIMVHDRAHLAPPKELWTRHNIAQLDANVGRPVPLFQESSARRHTFEFVGWYRVMRWGLCKGGSTAVQAFVARRKVSQVDKSREYWVGVLGQDWARVELERVEDASLGNPMERRAS
ncbi:hypothetical protein PHLGIDRAFT_429279 [Phlebiopsis gigantea 11061_1 CR5-6]|uniref:Uncharacterized protein n=1 Tax=Phlebiopsis gigantea (strain 11061_1 CR5-6) TaxID=745531 RepID=A0A0C3NPV6_PHLG1|nr:hypothetical protein PHLGIDRAFT_429279 [Phlebiopsis gigantea 11061_1 CR5-6]